MLGLRPTTTGIYGLAPWFRDLPQWRDRVTLPQHFAARGYPSVSRSNFNFRRAGV